jgi:hypothetical protein
MRWEMIMNGELIRIWNDASLTILKYYPGICLRDTDENNEKLLSRLSVTRPRFEPGTFRRALLLHRLRIKGKVVPVLLTEHHAMEAYWGSGGIVLIFYLG